MPTVRHAVAQDHARVDAVIDEWWGGRAMRRMLPRLFFQHFGDTSFIVEDDDALVAFLVGFVSSSRPGEAYIHFVGVRPDLRGAGLGRDLYERFFGAAVERGCDRVGCVTAPVNTGSIAFHRAMGFELVEGDTVVDGIEIHTAYDGVDGDRVVFRRALP